MRWVWVVIALSLSSTVYLTIRYGLRPKPIPVMNPTEFQEFREIGVVVYKRLRQHIRAERLVVLGSSDEIANSSSIWTGFVEAALAENEKLVAFVREGLPSILPAGSQVEVVQFTEEQSVNGELLQLIGQRLKRGQLVVVHARTLEATHLAPRSLSKRLDPVLRHPVPEHGEVHDRSAGVGCGSWSVCRRDSRRGWLAEIGVCRFQSRTKIRQETFRRFADVGRDGAPRFERVLGFRSYAVI